MTGMTAPTKKNLIQGFVIFLIALLFSLTIGESIFGKLLAQWTLDRFIRSDAPIVENQIVLIDITEEDYNQVFGRRRPLDPAIIIELVRAAYSAGAKLIAVDISTADWPSESEKLMSKVPPGAAVVWARDFYLDRQSGKPHRRLERLLGDVVASSGECYGVPALGREAGIVRYFYSGLKIEKWEPSFINQIAHRTEHGACLQPEDRDEELNIINFSAQIRTESASTLLAQWTGVRGQNMRTRSWSLAAVFTVVRTQVSLPSERCQGLKSLVRLYLRPYEGKRRENSVNVILC